MAIFFVVIVGEKTKGNCVYITMSSVYFLHNLVIYIYYIYNLSYYSSWFAFSIPIFL